MSHQNTYPTSTESQIYHKFSKIIRVPRDRILNEFLTAKGCYKKKCDIFLIILRGGLTWSCKHSASVIIYRGQNFFVLTLNRPGGGGGGIHPQAGSFLCCAETVSSRKLKLSDFYYILIGLNSEYKAVPWDIHCCHGNAIVEGCSVKFWLKSVENCIFQLKLFSNLSLGLLFVISISKLPPIPNFKQIRLKTKKLGFSAIF